MSRTETLAILGDIVDQLDPLDESEPGSPLRSADWNLVIGSVISLAKLVASREETLEAQLEGDYAPARHDHRGEATLTWFEPATRQLLEAATGGSANQRIAQKRIEKEIGGLRSEIKELRADLTNLRLSLDGLRDADFARSRGQARIENDVLALRGLEDGIGELSSRISGIDDSITSVLTFRDEIEGPDGNRIDIGALQARVGDLEGLRENLITADGELVRIREIESAIARLNSDVTGRDELDAMIVTRVSDAGFLEDAGLLDQIAGQVQDTLDPRIAATESGIADLQTGMSALDASITPLGTRLSGAENRLAGIDARIDGLDTLAPRLDRSDARLARVETGLAGVSANTARIDALDANLRTLGTRVDGFGTTVTLAAENAAAISDLATRTGTLETRTASLGETTTRLATLETQITALNGTEPRLGALESGQSDLTGRLDLAEAELTLLDGTDARITGLEGRTTTVEQRQTRTDQRVNRLETGSSRVVEERLAVLEERVANNGASITELRRTQTTILRTPTGDVTPILREPTG